MLVKEERTPKVVGDKVVIETHIVEELDLQDYIVNISQREKMKEEVERTITNYNMLSKVKEEVEKILEKQQDDALRVCKGITKNGKA